MHVFSKVISILYKYDPIGKLQTSIERKQQSKCWQTVENGVTEIENGKRIDFHYDSLGFSIGVKKSKGSKDFSLYIKERDLLGRIIEERIENTDGKILAKTKYTYSSQGEVSQVIGFPNNQESILTQYEYDAFNRPCKIVDAFGHETVFLYDDGYINELGQKVHKRTQIDPKGVRTEEVFDAADNLAKTRKINSSGKLLSEEEYSYTPRGENTLEVHNVLSSGKFLRTYELGQEFSAGGQMKKTFQASGNSCKREVSFNYSRYGDLSKEHLPGFKSPLIYEYDSRGYLDSLEYPQEGLHSASYTFLHDDRGFLEEVETDEGYCLRFEREANGQVLSEAIEDQIGMYSVNCTYDGEGLIESIKLPDGSSIKYSYDGPFIQKVVRVTKKKNDLYSYQVISRDQMGLPIEEKLIGKTGKRFQSWDVSGSKNAVSTDYYKDKIPEDGIDPLQNVLKRESSFGGRDFSVQYEYDDFSQLVSEKGENELFYSYDSLGNRLQKNGSSCSIDPLNQLTSGNNSSYTFTKNGNISTKTVDGKTWKFQKDALGRVIRVSTPDKKRISFVYDQVGRKLTKKVIAEDGEEQVYRYFYLGQTELGCLNEKGEIVGLKVPANPNHPEKATSIAFELNGKLYAPIYDLQGNVACIVDSQTKKFVEEYRYSSFGEEAIFGPGEKALEGSSINNPWRYQGKRTDDEIGLIYFGQRFYDPKEGRWMGPDPLGFTDGPNLYVFCKNNPWAFVDYLGLASDNRGKEEDFLDYFYGEFEPHCRCEHHRDCKRGGDIGPALAGIGHGVVDFMINSIHDLETSMAYIGADVMDLSVDSRAYVINSLELDQASRMMGTDNWIQDTFDVDSSDPIYSSFRSKTTSGLEIASLATITYGGIKALKTFSAFSKISFSSIHIESQINRGISLAGSKRLPLHYAPYQTVRNRELKIMGRSYKGHALDRMQDRGIMPRSIENTIKTGKISRSSRPGEVVYYDAVNKIKVITNLGK